MLYKALISLLATIVRNGAICAAGKHTAAVKLRMTIALFKIIDTVYLKFATVKKTVMLG